MVTSTIKMKRTVGFIVVVAGIIAVGLYMYNKPHKNISLTEPDFKMTSQSLFDAFNNDEANANALYIGKVIAVKGKVKNVSKEDVLKITLETTDMLSGIVCEMSADAKETTITIGSEIEIKGICTGMLMDVVLTKCQF